MTGIASNLYWHKYRPTSANNVIMTDRVRNTLFQDGEPIRDNFLLYGPPGMGKSTLAAIMCAGRDTLRMNASYNSSVDDLRDTISIFCRTYGIQSSGEDKVVWLDEFDGVSKAYQEALRAFMEDNIERVNFIATCNDITKIIPGIMSRFKMVDFAPQSSDEAEYLMKGYAVRLAGAMTHSGHSMDQAEAMAFVKSSFPDFRRIFNDAQMSVTIGKTEALGTNDDLFKMALSKSQPPAVMDYVVNNWTNKIPTMLNELGRPFAKWIFANKPEYSPKMVEVMDWVDECGRTLPQSIDPTLTGVALLCKIISKLQ